ncbi:MAG: PH domain-containing protein [Eggerthellaceae bacterium]|nr:PH domain-containing protein [Eggerthellaceae bacterium]
MAKWFCPQCGQENQGNFCIACGTPIPKAVAEPSGGIASEADADSPVEVGHTVQASPFVVTFETGKHYKVHKSYVWLGPAVAVLAVLVVVLLNSIQGIMQGLSALQASGVAVSAVAVVAGGVVGLAVLYGILVGVYMLAYKNMSFVFDEREFSFYSGIITKRRVHLPYARVQSVNHRATIVQRLAGVCSVSIDSAGGSSNKALRVPFLRLETAERMRVDLFVRKAAVEAGLEQAVVYNPSADPASLIGAQAEAERMSQGRATAPTAPGVPQAAGAAGATSMANPNALDTVGGVVGEWRGAYGGFVAGLEPVSYEYGLANHELLFTSASHGMPIAVAIIVGLSALVSVATIAFAADDFSRFIVAVSIPIVLGSMLVTWLIGVLGTAISFGNFRARRRGSRIEVERGLLQRDFSGIDISRVQSIEIRQSFIRRIIGYCEISFGRIDAAGDKNEKQNNSSRTHGLVVHPSVKIDRVDEILDGLAPELSDRPRTQELAKLPAPAFRRAILRRCVWYNVGLYILIGLAIIVALVNSTLGGMPASAARGFYGMAGLLAVFCVIYTVARAVGAVFWARGSGYTWNRTYLMLYNDGLSTERSIIPRQKIQSGRTRSNPFQRRLDLTGITAVTAAGTRSTSAKLLDVPDEVGSAYLDWLKPRR